MKWPLAIELPLFSNIMHDKNHSKEFSERNLILTRVVKRRIREIAISLAKQVWFLLDSFETAMPSDLESVSLIRKSRSL